MSIEKQKIETLIKELEAKKEPTTYNGLEKSLVNVFEENLIKNLKEQLKSC